MIVTDDREKSFSKQKTIKIIYVPRYLKERLTKLSLLSIQNKTLDTIEKIKFIHNFGYQKVS